MFVMPVTRTRHNGQAYALSRAIDRLFDDTVRHAFVGQAVPASRLPALDLRETDQAYTVKVDLPGVAKDKVKVTVDGKRVSIEAAATEAGELAEGERLLVRERSSVTFARSFTLPVEVDEAASQAKLENGVLALTLSKKVKPALAQLAIA
jgi:HSP20 family protein